MSMVKQYFNMHSKTKITRSDDKKMHIFIFKSNHGGGGGNSHLILVHLCRRYFSDPPYSCIPKADCRNVYLFMYDLYSFATHRCKYFMQC